MLNPSGRVAMITGASRGIGKAVAARLIASGFKVSAGVRDPSGFTDTDQVVYRHYDAEQPETADSWLAETLEAFGAVHALANVAGIFRSYNFHSENEDELDEMWRINAKAPIRLIRLALPHLRACGEGRVINVVSVSGKALFSPMVGYAASKHAMMAAAKAVRREAWDDGVRATSVCCGYVLTDMGQNATRVSREEMTKPEDLAEIIHTIMLLPNSAGVPEIVVDCLDQW